MSRELATYKKKKRPKDAIKILGPAILLLIFFVFVAFQFAKPAPSKHVVMGAGEINGAYDAFAQQYREILAHD
ncbi:MAG: hypothetical protein GKR87_10510 [Kiritimatiellae bacterium]|nr:hypothetical protein [Kiritimatiellia bacterium]